MIVLVVLVVVLLYAIGSPARATSLVSAPPAIARPSGYAGLTQPPMGAADAAPPIAPTVPPPDVHPSSLPPGPQPPALAPPVPGIAGSVPLIGGHGATLSFGLGSPVAPIVHAAPVVSSVARAAAPSVVSQVAPPAPIVHAAPVVSSVARAAAPGIGSPVAQVAPPLPTAPQIVIPGPPGAPPYKVSPFASAVISGVPKGRWTLAEQRAAWATQQVLAAKWYAAWKAKQPKPPAPRPPHGGAGGANKPVHAFKT